MGRIIRVVPRSCRAPSRGSVGRSPHARAATLSASSLPHHPPAPSTHTQVIPLPKGKNLTLLPPKNLTAASILLKAVLEEAIQQNTDVLQGFKNRTAVELAEEVEEWRTEHDGGPPGKVLWKLLPKGRR